MSFRGKLIHLIEEKLEEPTDEYLEDEEEKEEEENVDNKSTVSGQVSVKTATADDQTNKNHVFYLKILLIFIFFKNINLRPQIEVTH